MNLTQKVMVLKTHILQIKLEYQFYCVLSRLNINVPPLRMKTAITEHKNIHFIRTINLMVLLQARQHR